MKREKNNTVPRFSGATGSGRLEFSAGWRTQPTPRRAPAGQGGGVRAGWHAHLEGLNLVGLKRRDFNRETISALRSAYRLLGLISFLTYGKDECRAWSVRQGADAVEGAGQGRHRGGSAREADVTGPP